MNSIRTGVQKESRRTYYSESFVFLPLVIIMIVSEVVGPLLAVVFSVNCILFYQVLVWDTATFGCYVRRKIDKRLVYIFVHYSGRKEHGYLLV